MKRVYLELVLLLSGITAFSTIAFSLWYGFFLPGSYYVAVAALAVILAAHMILYPSSKLLIIQIVLILLLARNVYSLSMNYSIIPFGDGNWDYGVARTFMQENRVFIIENSSHLALYSGWPVLHVLAVTVSSVSGLDIYQVALLLPLVLGMCSFAFVYLIVEKMRKSLKLAAFVTPIALLIYAVSPESIFWPMQFVRQNMGILLLTIFFFLIGKAISDPPNRRYKALILIFGMLLVMAHHLTSFVAVLYLLLFAMIAMISMRSSKTRLNKILSWPGQGPYFLGTALGMLVFLFLWWDKVATMMWSYIESGVSRMVYLIEGIRQPNLVPRHAVYPSLLTPDYAVNLLLVRDILIYLPAILGFIIIIRKSSEKPERSFILYSTLIFGIIIILDNFLFGIETLRVIMLALPFVVLLSASFYSQVLARMPKWRILIVSALTGILLFSCFIGLWGHSFAPIHLYDPSISPDAVGERSKNFARVADFSGKINAQSYNVIWSDDRSPLLSLLEPDSYYKISWLPTENFQELGSSGSELVYEVKNLNLYFYHAGVFSPALTLQDAEVIRYSIEQRLESRFSCLYSDGANQVWISGLSA